MNRHKSAVLLIASLILSFAIPLYSQAPAGPAHLKGALTDPSGAPVGAVMITAQSEESNTAEQHSAVSADDGSYILELPAGRYRIHFSRESFATREVVLSLSSGEVRDLSLHLELRPLSDRVIVTAQTVPTPEQQTTAPTDVISAETISQRQSVSVPELLQFSPGVAIGRTGPFGGTASIFLNGGDSDFTKVLVDGTPVNPPGSAVDFSSITTENLDKIEIVRGAESAIYGSDAVSGVVQLFTHRGDTRIPAFSLFSEGGNLASARGGADLSGLLGKFDYSAAASYFETNGQGPNDAFLNRTLSGNFGYSFSESNQLHLSLRNNTSDAGIPGPTLQSPPNLYQGYGQHIFSANARWDFITGSRWHHEVMGTESYTRQHSFATAQAAFPYDALLTFNRAGFQEQSTYLTKNFAVTAGYQYEVENGAVSYISPGHLRRNNQAGYLDFRYSPLRRLTLDAGVRAEANSSFGTRVVPRVGGSYVLHYGKGFLGDTRYHAFYGQGIKEPRFDQTFGTDPCYPGNPLLKPEASKGWTTGFEQKLAADRWKLSADYFYNRFYNIVSFAYDPAPNPNFCGTYFNTDLAIARGVNLASEFRLRKWLFFSGNYTYNNSRVLNSENPNFDPALVPGNRLIRRPVNSGSLGINLYYARVNWNFLGYFTGPRTDSNFVDPTQTTNPGYARFDMAASYDVSRGLALTARAMNLFNKRYQEALGYPALGQAYMFGLRYKFAGRN
jgi:vitamin B12 transporter